MTDTYTWYHSCTYKQMAPRLWQVLVNRGRRSSPHLFPKVRPLPTRLHDLHRKQNVNVSQGCSYSHTWIHFMFACAQYRSAQMGHIFLSRRQLATRSHWCKWKVFSLCLQGRRSVGGGSVLSGVQNSEHFRKTWCRIRFVLDIDFADSTWMSQMSMSKVWVKVSNKKE